MLADILEELGIETAPAGHEHTREGWLNVDCPLCSPGWKHYRFGIPEGGFVGHCWSCGKRGVAETLIEASGKPARVVYALLMAGDHYKRGDVKDKPQGKLVLPEGLGPILPQHKRYLKKRGIDPEEAVGVWGLQGIGLLNQRLKWRVFFPITHRRKVVSWTTRSISDKVKHRYISASQQQEAVPHKTLLFGESHAGHAAIVCEGPIDAIRIGPGAVSTFGSAFTPSQVLQMLRFPVRAVAYDNEPSAQKQAEKLCAELRLFPGETLLVRLSAKDPGSCGPKELKQLRSILK